MDNILEGTPLHSLSSIFVALEILQANIVSDPIIKINIYTAKLMLIFIMKPLIFINTSSVSLSFLSSIKLIIIKVYKNYTINACPFIIYINNSIKL